MSGNEICLNVEVSNWWFHHKYIKGCMLCWSVILNPKEKNRCCNLGDFTIRFACLPFVHLQVCKSPKTSSRDQQLLPPHPANLTLESLQRIEHQPKCLTLLSPPVIALIVGQLEVENIDSEEEGASEAVHAWEPKIEVRWVAEGIKC